MRGGNGSVPCSRRFLSALCALIFFSCGSREQPVSQITKAVTDIAGAWGELCTLPESSPPSSWESHRNARSWFYPPTNGTSAGCCQRCGEQQQDAQPPHLAKADSEMPTHSSEGPAACCQVAEGKSRNASGIQVLANGFAVSWECGPDLRVQRGWMVEQADLCG